MAYGPGIGPWGDHPKGLAGRSGTPLTAQAAGEGVWRLSMWRSVRKCIGAACRAIAPHRIPKGRSGLKRYQAAPYR